MNTQPIPRLTGLNTDILTPCYTVPENFDLLVFQILVASIHLPPTSRQSMAYLPVISRCGWLLALSVTMPTSRAARGDLLSVSPSHLRRFPAVRATTRQTLTAAGYR